MKKKLMNALSKEGRMISENYHYTNRNLVIGLMTIFATIDHLYIEDDSVTLIYYGDSPLTFLLLTIASYLFGYKAIKVMSMEKLQDKIIVSDRPVIFIDRDYYSDEISKMIRFKPFVLFHAHNLSFNLKMTVSTYKSTFDYMKMKREKYESMNHSVLMEMIKQFSDIDHWVDQEEIVLELPSSGIHSPEKYIGFSRKNIESIVNLISELPYLMNHNIIRIFSTIESSFFYILSAYVNEKILLINVTYRNNLAIMLHKRTQAVVLDSLHLKYLWHILLKEYISSNMYSFFNKKGLRWVIGIKITILLRSFFSHSLKSLYIINADIPHELKQLLRNSFLRVVFLYGIRETGNIIGSNLKRDRIFKKKIWKFKINKPLPLDSYKIENNGKDIHVVADDVTGVLFVNGTAVANSAHREYISQSKTEDEFFINTYDVGSVTKGVINFLTPVGTAVSMKDELNFDLYFAERSLLLMPEIVNVVSFDYHGNWYIGVQVDESYLDRTNLNLDDIQRQLDGIRVKMNTYLPVSSAIRGIKITTNDLLLNTEGKPIRFVHKMDKISI